MNDPFDFTADSAKAYNKSQALSEKDAQLTCFIQEMIFAAGTRLCEDNLKLLQEAEKTLIGYMTTK